MADARLLVVAIDDRERVLSIVKHAKRLRPDLHVIARAYDRIHVYDLFSVGCNDIVRETFDSAVRAGRYSLEALGTAPNDAESLIRAFVDADRKSMRSLAELHDPDIPPNKNSAYMAMLKQIRSQEAQMTNSIQSADISQDVPEHA